MYVIIRLEVTQNVEGVVKMLNKIRQLRQQKGISQSHISKKLGYKRPSGYSNIEMGRNRLSFTQAVIIAEILGVTVGELSDDYRLDEKLHGESKSTA